MKFRKIQLNCICLSKQIATRGNLRQPGPAQPSFHSDRGGTWTQDQSSGLLIQDPSVSPISYRDTLLP